MTLWICLVSEWCGLATENISTTANIDWMKYTELSQ